MMLATALVAGSATADEKSEPAAKETKSADAKGETPAPDPMAVPDGTPEELFKFIEKLERMRPSSDSREVVLAFFEKQTRALLKASDKILAAKPTLEQGRDALEYKIIALQILDRLGDPDAAKKLAALPDSLDQAGMKELARDARYFLLKKRIQQSGDLSKKGFMELLKDIKRWLSEAEPDPVAAMLAMNAVMNAERDGYDDLALLAYADFAKFLAKSNDRKTLNLAALMQGAARRLGLVGKTFKLEGATVDGKPFSWSPYKDKIVLVSFFSTACPACRAEMPNLLKNYKNYHDRGFDVVTVSTDEDRGALKDYLESHPFPWTFLLDDNEAMGTDKSMSTYYGIIAIPQTMLVGRDGKVIALNLRGQRLDDELAKLFGPAETKKPEEKKADEKKK